MQFIIGSYYNVLLDYFYFKMISKYACSQGNAHPIEGGNMLDACYFHGHDGLGNNNFPDDEEYNTMSNESADNKIIALCLEAAERNISVTLVCLGPLTNFASAILKNNTFYQSLHDIVIMGGCGNGRGNVKRTTEFNITADPEAASIVFKELERTMKSCTIVSWELTLQYPIPWNMFDEHVLDTVNSRSSRLHTFFREISHLSYGPQQRNTMQRGGAIICDLLAVAIALNQNLANDVALVNVEIELQGSLTRGQTVVDWDCYDQANRPKNCRWVASVHAETYHRMFVDTFAEKTSSVDNNFLVS